MNGEYSVAVANEVKAKARNPAGDAKELVDLVIAYAKQETLEPLKGLGKKAALGLGGALLLGLGGVFVSIGALRVMQTETDWFEEHNVTYLPPHGAREGGQLEAWQSARITLYKALHVRRNIQVEQAIGTSRSSSEFCATAHKSAARIGNG